MRCACIDIGSNTTALLVADGDGERIRPVGTRRVFTMLGASILGGEIPKEKIAEVCETVAEYVERARKLNAERIAIVATHALREAVNGDQLASEIESAHDLPLRVLTTDEEAEYSFRGALGTSDDPSRPTVVIDAGGGSTEVTWHCGGKLQTASFAIGSSSLRGRFLRSDPPTDEEIEVASSFAASAFRSLEVPPECTTVLAVGGGATTAREILGGLIDPAGVARVLETAVRMDSANLAAKLKVERRRAHLLPAGLIILGAASARIGMPLEVGLGGLREGIALELTRDAKSG